LPEVLRKLDCQFTRQVVVAGARAGQGLFKARRFPIFQSQGLADWAETFPVKASSPAVNARLSSIVLSMAARAGSEINKAVAATGNF
jgi:hypothetical protein